MFLDLRIPLARAHALAQRAGLGTKVTVVVVLLTALVGLGVALCWMRGGFGAAFIVTAAFLAFIASPDVHPPWDNVLLALIVIWGPFFLWKTVIQMRENDQKRLAILLRQSQDSAGGNVRCELVNRGASGGRV